MISSNKTTVFLEVISSTLVATPCFILGGYGFMILDVTLYKMNKPASQLAAISILTLYFQWDSLISGINTVLVNIYLIAMLYRVFHRSLYPNVKLRKSMSKEITKHTKRFKYE